MGLAISIVSAVPERVWYCQKKGYKPWFNPSRADVKEHCVWYDEEKLLKDVEARIKAPVARIDPATLALPKELLRKLGREEGERAPATSACTANASAASSTRRYRRTSKPTRRR